MGREEETGAPGHPTLRFFLKTVKEDPLPYPEPHRHPSQIIHCRTVSYDVKTPRNVLQKGKRV